MCSQEQALQESEGLGSGAEPSRKLNCSAAASETPPCLTESLRVGMTLQRCPPRMHRARALYHRLPPLTSHCNTALGEPVPSGQGHFKGRPPGGIQQTFPAAWEKARSRTLTCRHILFCCYFFLTGITRNNIRVIIFRRKWGRGGR